MTSYGPPQEPAPDGQPAQPQPQPYSQPQHYPQPQPYQQPAQQGYTPPPGTAYPPQQGYTPPPTTVPTAPPPARKRSPLLIVGLIVLGLLLLCGIGTIAIVGGAFGLTQGVADVGEKYMAALRDGNYQQAFDLSTKALQAQVESPTGLEQALSSKQPATWTFTSRNISNGVGSLSGNVTFKAGSSGTVDMELTKEGNDWKVSYINLK